MSNLCLWCFTGPWFLGELLEGHTGVVFVWGMFVYGSYLPLCLTYVYGVSLVLRGVLVFTGPWFRSLVLR